MSKGKALALSAAIVTISTFAGRIVGFAREVVIANKFGASAETDAFLVAFTIPNMLYSLVVMGALSASFIPVFSGLLANEKEHEAWRVAHTVSNLMLIVFGLIVLVLVAFAPQVIFLAAPGMARGAASGQVELAANLLRLMAPSLIFLGISGLMAGVLNSYNHFALPSLVAFTQNIVVVGAILALADRIGIYGAAVGLLLGSIGQVAIQLPALIKRKIPYRVIFDIRSEQLKKIGKLFLPVLVGLAASQSNVVVDKWFASFLEAGSISYLNYAYKVASLPVGTLIAAVAIVLFPTLSRHAAKDDIDALRSTISLGTRIIALVAVPAGVGLFVLSFPITRLLFEHGAFERTATLATAAALAAYAFGIAAMGLNMLLVRAFYALHDGITPLKTSIAYIVILIGVDVILMRAFSHVGLAIGYALATTIMVLLLYLALRRRLQGIDEAQIVRSLAKIAVAALVMGVTSWYSSAFLSGAVASASKMGELIVVAAAICIGLLAYVVALTVLRASELTMVWQMLRSRLQRKQLATERS